MVLSLKIASVDPQNGEERAGFIPLSDDYCFIIGFRKNSVKLFCLAKLSFFVFFKKFLRTYLFLPETAGK